LFLANESRTQQKNTTQSETANSIKLTSWNLNRIKKKIVMMAARRNKNIWHAMVDQYGSNDLGLDLNMFNYKA
jgi:hypothetical protein